MRDLVHAAFLSCLEHLAVDWDQRVTPHEVRLNPNLVAILTQVRRLVNDPETGLTPDLFNEYAPTFVDQFRSVMLRELGTPTLPYEAELHVHQ